MEFSHAFANAEVNSGNTVAAGLAAPWLGRITTISQPQSRKWPHHKLGLFFWGAMQVMPISVCRQIFVA